MVSPCLLWVCVVLSISGISGSLADPLANDASKEPGITPRLAECTLTVGERILKPLRTQSPGRQEYRIGGTRLMLAKEKVFAVQASDDAEQWIAQARDGHLLYWLTGDPQTAYLGGYQQVGRFREQQLDQPPRVRRLDVASGKWLPDLPIGAQEKVGSKEKENILSVLAGNNHVVVLSLIGSTDKDGQDRLQAYRVSCFVQRSVKPLWSRKFRSTGSKPESGAFLWWAGSGPNAASSRIQHLAWLDDAILVCAGEVQDILCLNRDTGKKCWWFERIWEEERDFMGPSVWQHFLGGARGPRDEAEKDKPDEKHQPGGKKPISVQGGSIIGGPVVVSIPAKQGREKSHSIFVAVAKLPNKPFAEYLADCVVYEMDAQGSLLSMAHLPRVIQGSPHRVQAEGIVWACQENAFVRVACSKRQDLIGMGPGGPDLISRIPWYRQMDSDVPEALLASNKAGDPTAFSDGWAVRLPAGGYILHQGDSVYHFPLALIDLKTGLDQRLLLHVPYKGKIPLPTSNYSRDGNHWHTMGPHILAITQVQAEEQRLRLTLGMKEWSAALEFNLADLVRSFR